MSCVSHICFAWYSTGKPCGYCLSPLRCACAGTPWPSVQAAEVALRPSPLPSPRSEDRRPPPGGAWACAGQGHRRNAGGRGRSHRRLRLVDATVARGCVWGNPRALCLVPLRRRVAGLCVTNVPVAVRWIPRVQGVTRRATSVRQGNRFSVGMGPVSKATQ